MNIKCYITDGICLDFPFPHYLNFHSTWRALWSWIITMVIWQTEQEKLQGACCAERTKGLFWHYWTSTDAWNKLKSQVKVLPRSYPVSSNYQKLVKFMFLKHSSQLYAMYKICFYIHTNKRKQQTFSIYTHGQSLLLTTSLTIVKQLSQMINQQ